MAMALHLQHLYFWIYALDTLELYQCDCKIDLSAIEINSILYLIQKLVFPFVVRSCWTATKS